MKNWLIPHPNVANTEFGDAHLKRITTLFNENFSTLDGLVQSAQSSLKSLDSAKSPEGHTHDLRYARLSHSHTLNELAEVSSALDNKAELNHEHSQYLTEITTHQHQLNEIENLIETLNGKAPLSHTHTFSEIDGLDDLATYAASQEYVNKADNVILLIANAYTDSAIAASVPGASASMPKKDSRNGAIGDSKTYAKGDHEHPLNVASGDDGDEFEAGDVVLEFDEGESGEGTSDHYARSDHTHRLNVGKQNKDKVLCVRSEEDKIRLVDSIDASQICTVAGQKYSAVQLLDEYLNLAAFNEGIGSLVMATSSTNGIKLSPVTSLGNGYLKNGNDGLQVEDKTFAELTNGKIAIGNIPIGNDANSVAIGNHTHEFSEFPGFGTTSDTCATGNHKHSQYLTDEDIADCLTDNDIGSSVQAHSNKLDAIEVKLNDDGTIPVSAIHDNNCTKSCLAICTNGTFGHSSSGLTNAASFGGDWPTLQKISECFSVVSGSLKVLFSRMTGGTSAASKVATTDANGNITLNTPGNGLQVASGTLDLNFNQDGGITADENGIKLSGVGKALDSTGFIEHKIDPEGLNNNLIIHWPTFDANGRFVGFSSTQKTEINYMPGGL